MMRKALAVALVFCGFFGTSPGTIARAFEPTPDVGRVAVHSRGNSAIPLVCDTPRALTRR